MANAVLDDPSKLFVRLRAERERQELTVEWIADRLGITKQTISEYELEKSRPSEKLLRKWLGVLKLPESWAADWNDWRAERDIVKILEKRKLPPDQIEAQRVSLRNALRIRREE